MGRLTRKNPNCSLQKTLGQEKLLKNVLPCVQVRTKLIFSSSKLSASSQYFGRNFWADMQLRDILSPSSSLWIWIQPHEFCCQSHEQMVKVWVKDACYMVQAKFYLFFLQLLLLLTCLQANFQAEFDKFLISIVMWLVDYMQIISNSTFQCKLSDQNILFYH